MSSSIAWQKAIKSLNFQLMRACVSDDFVMLGTRSFLCFQCLLGIARVSHFSLRELRSAKLLANQKYSGFEIKGSFFKRGVDGNQNLCILASESNCDSRNTKMFLFYKNFIKLYPANTHNRNKTFLQDLTD